MRRSEVYWRWSWDLRNSGRRCEGGWGDGKEAGGGAYVGVDEAVAAVAIVREEDWRAAVAAAIAARLCREDSYRKGCDRCGAKSRSRGGIGGGRCAEGQYVRLVIVLRGHR